VPWIIAVPCHTPRLLHNLRGIWLSAALPVDNEVDGVPTTGDHWLLTTQARDEFGFEGYICSDFGAITGLGPKNHATAANDEECVQQFIEAGGSMNGHDFGECFPKQKSISQIQC
jgi:beta-glucosidase